MPNAAVDGSQVFAQVARDLAEQPDMPQTTRRLVCVTTELTGCDCAALWELRDGNRPVLRASTDAALGRALSHFLTEVDEGPVRQALGDRATCLMPDLDTETRWPRYVQAMEEQDLPIRSALAFSLDLGGKNLGALVLYSDQPNYFTKNLIDIGTVLANHAALALDLAHNADAVKNLRQALESNHRISVALGILTALHQLTGDQAFAMMRAVSQNEHVNNRDVAEHAILTGALPDWPSHPPGG